MSRPSNSSEGVSDEQWDDWQRRFADSDAESGFEVTRDFVPFNQMNDMFTGAFWDPLVKSGDTDAFFASYRTVAAPRGQAGWAISDIISDRAAATGLREGFQGSFANDTPVAPMWADLSDPADETAEIKALARMFGADLVGITEVDER
ncbi:hypothetical protein [Profundibacter sp.]